MPGSCFDFGGGYTKAIMSAPAPRHRDTFEEYLAVEEMARVRHEFYG